VISVGLAAAIRLQAAGMQTTVFEELGGEHYVPLFRTVWFGKIALRKRVSPPVPRIVPHARLY
jgi:hypothetical protein